MGSGSDDSPLSMLWLSVMRLFRRFESASVPLSDHSLKAAGDLARTVGRVGTRGRYQKSAGLDLARLHRDEAEIHELAATDDARGALAPDALRTEESLQRRERWDRLAGMVDTSSIWRSASFKMDGLKSLAIWLFTVSM